MKRRRLGFERLEKKEAPAAICLSGSFAGLGVSSCIGTQGVSSYVSYGWLQVGRETSWNGQSARCVGIAAGGGVGLVADASFNICRAPQGSPYSTASAGAGFGLGAKGPVFAAATFEWSLPVRRR